MGQDLSLSNEVLGQLSDILLHPMAKYTTYHTGTKLHPKVSKTYCQVEHP